MVITALIATAAFALGFVGGTQVGKLKRWLAEREARRKGITTPAMVAEYMKRHRPAPRKTTVSVPLVQAPRSEDSLVAEIERLAEEEENARG